MTETEHLKIDIESVNLLTELFAVEASGLLKKAGLEDSELRKVCGSLNEREEWMYLTEEENSALYGVNGITPAGLAEEMSRRIDIRKRNAIAIFPQV